MQEVWFTELFGHAYPDDAVGILKETQERFYEIVSAIVAGRDWADFPDALDRLWRGMGYAAGGITESTVGDFVRDIGTLFGSLWNRITQPDHNYAIGGPGAPVWDPRVGPELQVKLDTNGAPEDYWLNRPNDRGERRQDGDANVHHFVWATQLGYFRGDVGYTLNWGKELVQGGPLGMEDSDLKMGEFGVTYGIALRQAVSSGTFSTPGEIWRRTRPW